MYKDNDPVYLKLVMNISILIGEQFEYLTFRIFDFGTFTHAFIVCLEYCNTGLDKQKNSA